jgi:hypothetical protein
MSRFSIGRNSIEVTEVGGREQGVKQYCPSLTRVSATQELRRRLPLSSVRLAAQCQAVRTGQAGVIIGERPGE